MGSRKNYEPRATQSKVGRQLFSFNIIMIISIENASREMRSQREMLSGNTADLAEFVGFSTRRLNKHVITRSDSRHWRFVPHESYWSHFPRNCLVHVRIMTVVRGTAARASRKIRLLLLLHENGIQKDMNVSLLPRETKSRIGSIPGRGTTS